MGCGQGESRTRGARRAALAMGCGQGGSQGLASGKRRASAAAACGGSGSSTRPRVDLIWLAACGCPRLLCWLFQALHLPHSRSTGPGVSLLKSQVQNSGLQNPSSASCSSPVGDAFSTWLM